MNTNRIILLLSFFCMACFSKGYAQTPDVAADTLQVSTALPKKVLKDAAYFARQRFVTDSIITHTWILPDSLINKNIIIDSIVKANTTGRTSLLHRFQEIGDLKKVSAFRTGKPLPRGERWVLVVLVVLLAIFAALKISFSKQLQSIVQSFFSNRVLNNLNREDNLFTSWPFLLLFVQFGFTLGMFFYLVSQYYHLAFVSSGFQFYVSISILIVVLYVVKILILRLLGYLFEVQKAVNEYVSILYLSYFNLSLVFIPLVIAFALSPLRYGAYYVVASFVLLAIIFIFQFIRAGINILSHYRFSKVYLFLYFCALEICPILILIKAIGF
ncbi:DUF4271 domain-containing protein [Pedobacter sp. PLR]|uniref:DUF4271 domain-containing protein n=1 Tax=Pedobacter sp. PLR TaxID=2994465 RepID=UPI0022454D52|nr:DUF4271 domain-containing protein [Pedobacter sp. PLR]MCX2450582.1 DUF4271 domain-containing protein [Pedobacter sp. PLR]